MFADPTVNLNALRNLCVNFACCSPESILMFFFMQAAASKRDRAVRLVYPPFFCKLETAVCRKPFRIRRHVFIWTSVLTMADTVTSHYIDLSSWITLYKSQWGTPGCTNPTVYTPHLHGTTRRNWFLHSMISMCPACSNINNWLRTCIQLAPSNTQTLENICFVSPTFF
jgi:hypothetical protein